MEHKLKVRNGRIIITFKKRNRYQMHITNYCVIMREKLETGEKGKRCLKCKRNISANNLLVASEKFSDQSTFSAASYQWKGSEALQRIYSTILECKIKRLLIVHKDSSLEISDLLVFSSSYYKWADNELHTEAITWRTKKTTVNKKFWAPYAVRKDLRDFSKIHSFYHCYSIIFPS